MRGTVGARQGHERGNSEDNETARTASARNTPETDQRQIRNSAGQATYETALAHGHQDAIILRFEDFGCL